MRHRQVLEHAQPQRSDKRLTTQLGLRLRTSFPVPDQEDAQIQGLLEKLAAKLQEDPPA